MWCGHLTSALVSQNERDQEVFLALQVRELKEDVQYTPTPTTLYPPYTDHTLPYLIDHLYMNWAYRIDHRNTLPHRP